MQRPCAIRLDDLRLSPLDATGKLSGVIVHHARQPSVLTFAGNPTFVFETLKWWWLVGTAKKPLCCRYQRAQRRLNKLRRTLQARQTKPNERERQLIESLQAKLDTIRASSDVARDHTVEINAKGFYRTGIYSDVVHVSDS